MAEDFTARLQDAKSLFRGYLQRYWWGGLVIIFLDFLWELMKHRILGATNLFIDNHVSLKWLKPTVLALQHGAFFHPIILAVELFIAGVFLLMALAYWETRPSRTSKKRSEAGLPLSRPCVVPVHYGTDERNNRSGLLLVNENDAPAYDVSVAEIFVGSSRLHFWGRVLPRVAKSDGKVLLEANIELTPGSGLLGSGLHTEMVRQHVDSLPVAITYKDSENRRYTTQSTIERDVLATGGLAVRLVEQTLQDVLHDVLRSEPLTRTDPQILLEYQWRYSGDYGQSDRLNTPVIVRNDGWETAVRIKVDDLSVGNWRAVFPLIPHLASKDERAISPSIQYDGMEITGVQGLIALLRPPTNAGLKESRITPARATYSNARGENFAGHYEFRWDHEIQKCVAVLVRLEKL